VKRASAPGKIILTGEYAVVFGHPGIAIPASVRAEVQYTSAREWTIHYEGVAGVEEKRNAFIQNILTECAKQRTVKPGTLSIRNEIPLGKGMGSSTALTIAIARAVGIEDRAAVLAIENTVNPGGSGIDFAVIWEEKPLYFRKGKECRPIALPEDLLRNAVLIDTGTPNEATPELVTRMVMLHVQGQPEIEGAIHTIGGCAQRLQNLVTLSPVEARQDFAAILRDHHRAQVALGVVTEAAQHCIREIENAGGAAKVIGAGGRTGGSGIVLALHEQPETLKSIAKHHAFPII
jgi:mevalonate kinase